MIKRKSLSKKTRFEVFKRDSFSCQYCGKSAPDVLLHVDHIIAVMAGGSNEIANLVTSCVDCNLGKGATSLDDNSVAIKQMRQLKQTNERLEQLKMIAQWRDGLKSIDDEALRLFESHLDTYYTVYLSEFGKNEFKKTIKKYGLNAVLEATGKSAESYLTDRDLKECRTKFLDYIPKICFWQEREKEHPEQAEFSKMCGYARKIWWSCYKPTLWESLNRYHFKQDVPIDALWECLRNAKGITKFNENVDSFLEAKFDG